MKFKSIKQFKSYEICTKVFCKPNNYLKEECKPNSQSAMHIIFFINVYTVKFK